MTGVSQTGSPGKKAGQLSKEQVKTGSKASLRSHGSSKNVDGRGDNQSLEQIAKNIQLEDDYEDDDFTIYFDKPSLINRLSELEEENLFRITELQDDEIYV